MNVLSLFDGMSCGQIALERAGVKVSKYYASELDKYAITVTQANYPDTVQLGDVTRWSDWDFDWAGIDLLIGGSPCQGFSFAGKQLAFDDPRSKLFFVYVDILNHIQSANPEVKFLLENVRMKKEYLDVISEQLGVEPVLINSSLVSAQNRQRYYWANWEFGQPEDRGLVLADILEAEVDPVFLSKPHPDYEGGSQLNPHYKSQANTVHDVEKKSPTICAGTHGYAMGHIRYNPAAIVGRKRVKALQAVDGKDIYYRKLTPTECERLQTVPDNYTAHVSNTQRYKMLGNGWTVDVIAHILKGMVD